MSESPNTTAQRTPWHLWVIGIIALLWNAMGAMDFVMTLTKNEAYMSAFTPEQLEFFYGFPVWLIAFWGIAVWGGVLGSLLLLFRTRFAVPTFLLSVIGMVITMIHNYGFSNGMEVVGDAFALCFTAVIFLIAVALFLYASRMKKRGVLA